MSDTNFGADVAASADKDPRARARRVGGWCFAVGALEVALRGLEVLASAAALLGTGSKPADFAELGGELLVPADVLAEVPALVAGAAPWEIARGLVFGALGAWLLVLGLRVRALAPRSVERLGWYVRAEYAAIVLGLVVDVTIAVPHEVLALRHVAEKLGGAEETRDLFQALPVMLSTAACASAALLALWPLLLSVWLRRLRAALAQAAASG